MRRLAEEHGAIAPIVALLMSTVLLGMGALAVDFGMLRAERRELQNGADAAALAVAMDYASGNPTTAAAQPYADANALDGAANATISPDPTNNEIVAVTSTRDPHGGTLVQPLLSRVLGNEGITVQAQATAAWGVPDMASGTLPLAVSLCEWEAVSGGSPESLPPATPQPEGPGTTLIFHNSTSPHDQCSVQPGFDADADGSLPAGWGWLEQSGCELEIHSYDEDNHFWVNKDPGNNPHAECLAQALGKPVPIPVFVDFLRTNPRDRYLLYSPAAFILTGWRFPGDSVNAPCSAPDTCVSGHFVRLSTLEGEIGTGPDLGVRVIQLRD